ncbi:hypothetical protein D9M68_865140 [compost metagenome]
MRLLPVVLTALRKADRVGPVKVRLKPRSDLSDSRNDTPSISVRSESKPTFNPNASKSSSANSATTAVMIT